MTRRLMVLFVALLVALPMVLGGTGAVAGTIAGADAAVVAADDEDDREFDDRDDDTSGDGDGDDSGGGDDSGDGDDSDDDGDGDGDDSDDGDGDDPGDDDPDEGEDGSDGSEGGGEPTTDVAGETESWLRLWGENRFETATAVSQHLFPDAGSAPVVVLARGDDPHGFADALAGTPLAHQLGAPLLITMPWELHAETAAELQRVLPPGGRVIILGREVAIEPQVEQAVRDLGMQTERVAGADRFATAVAIARELGDPTSLLLATGRNFPDALSAGAAAARIGGAVLLTEPDRPHPSTDAYLADRANEDLELWGVGGPSARAYPSSSTPLVGADRVATSVLVAGQFFTDPTAVGIATSERFPDALTGGVHVAARGGPMLLAPPTTVPTVLRDYLCAHEDVIDETFLYGGTLVISEVVREVVVSLTSGAAC